MIAIVTKYRGPTDRQGSRFIATASGKRVVVPYRHELTLGENHAEACKAFVKRWLVIPENAGEWVMGELGGSQAVFVWRGFG